MLINLLKDSAVYGGGDFFCKALAFFAFPIIAAVMSPVEFGALELIITTTLLFGILMNCGLNGAVARFYWDKDTDELDRPTLVSSGFAALILFGFLTLLLGGVAVPFLIPQIEKAELPMTWVAIASGMVLMVLTQWLGYLLDLTRLHFSPWRFFSLSLISRVLGLGLGVVAVVWFGWGIDGLLAVQAFSALATLPLALYLVRRDLTFQIELTWAKELCRYGFPYVFAGLAFWVFSSTDRWMLATMTSVEEVGIYSIALRFASLVLFVSAAFGQAWSPYAVKIRTDSPKIYRKIYAYVLLLLLFVMLMVGGGVALFSGELVGVLMPEEYGASSVPLAILCFGVILQSTLQVTAVGISLEKKTILFARLSWLAAIINLALNFLLIPIYGGIGAAWATTLSYLVLTGSYLFYTQRLHPLPIQWRYLALMLSLGGGILLLSIVENTVYIYGDIIALKLLAAILCAVLVWRVLPDMNSVMEDI